MHTLSRIIGNHVRLFRYGSTTTDVAASASRARADGVATIITGASHPFASGDTVTIADMGGVGYDAEDVVITVVDDTTFTYENAGDDEATAVDTAGTVTRTRTAGRTVKPTPTGTGWIDIGIVSDLSFDRTMTSDQIFAPNPGKIELYDVLETKVINGVKFTSEQLSPSVIEVLFATAALTESSTTFTPNAKVGKRFWIEILQYDQDDTLVNTVYLYCYTKINGDVKFADKHVTAAWEAQKLVSTLNSGKLAAV